MTTTTVHTSLWDKDPTPRVSTDGYAGRVMVFIAPGVTASMLAKHAEELGRQLMEAAVRETAPQTPEDAARMLADHAADSEQIARMGRGQGPTAPLRSKL